MPRRTPSLQSLGEFAEIARLSTRLGGSRFSPLVRQSIGDDAAVLRPPRGRELLLTTDALVESVHFDRRWDAAADIGWKAIVANVSDIAAMCGTPMAAVIAFGAPPSTPVAWIDALYRGIRTASRTFATPIVGGDTVRSPKGIVISVTVAGHVRTGGAVLRSGARPEDLVFVSGTLGTAAAALDALQRDPVPSTIASALFRKHRRPVPRLDVVETLRAKHIRPTAMIDISDGLVSDAGHIATESSVAIELDSRALPIAPALRKHAVRAGADAVGWALHSGEEYELLLTCHPRHAGALRTISALTCIGRVASGRGVFDTASGIRRRMNPQGFKHFGA